MLSPGLTPTRLRIHYFAPGTEGRKKPKTKKRHANLQTASSHQMPNSGRAWDDGMPLANSIHDQPREQRRPPRPAQGRGTRRHAQQGRKAGNRTEFLEHNHLLHRESRICRSGHQSIVSGEVNVDVVTGWRRPPISHPLPNWPSHAATSRSATYTIPQRSRRERSSPHPGLSAVSAV